LIETAFLAFSVKITDPEKPSFSETQKRPPVTRFEKSVTHPVFWKIILQNGDSSEKMKVA
jgi:hypothetical protein